MIKLAKKLCVNLRSYLRLSASTGSRNRKLCLIALLFIILFIISVNPVLADYGLEEAGKTAEIPSSLREATPASLIGQVIGIGLGLVGVIFLALMVYGGFLWMTARGDKKQTESARDLIIAATIGIIIIAAAYVITNFVIKSLVG